MNFWSRRDPLKIKVNVSDVLRVAVYDIVTLSDQSCGGRVKKVDGDNEHPYFLFGLWRKRSPSAVLFFVYDGTEEYFRCDTRYEWTLDSSVHRLFVNRENDIGLSRSVKVVNLDPVVKKVLNGVIGFKKHHFTL